MKMRRRWTLRPGKELEGGICLGAGARVEQGPRLLRLLSLCRSPPRFHCCLGTAGGLRPWFRLPTCIEPIDPPLGAIQELDAFEEKLIVLQSSRWCGQ